MTSDLPSLHAPSTVRSGARNDLVLACVAIAVMAVQLLWGLQASDSASYNIIWTQAFRQAWARGELYPRWLTDSFEGLGSPTFYFYPPLAFFLTGLIHALGVEVTRAITLATTLLLFASGVAMERWLRWRGTPSLLAAALYMALPYRVTDIYDRGALAEHAAFVWLPLIAIGIEALPRRWAPALLAASVAGLLLTHLVTALLALVFLIAPLGIRRVLQSRETLVPGLCGAIVGAGLAGFFLLPALTLQDQIQTDLLWTPHYQVTNWFIWNWDRSRWLAFGPLLLSCAGVVILAYQERRWWFWLTALAALSAFGLLPILGLPILSMVQFPWRTIGIVLFLGMTAFAGRRLSLRTTLLALCFLSLGWANEYGEAAQKILKWGAQPAAALDGMPDAAEYLPRGLKAGVTDLQRQPRLEAYSAYPRSSAVSFRRSGEHTIGRAAFPIWRLVHNGREIPYSGPLISFKGGPGEYRVERRWIWQEEVGAIVSALALMALVFMVFRGIGPGNLSWARVCRTRGTRTTDGAFNYP